MFQESEPRRREDNPRPLPRYKRKVKMQGVQNLNLESLLAAGDQEDSHQNDILFNVCSRGSLKTGDVVKGEKTPLLTPDIHWLLTRSSNNENKLLRQQLLFRGIYIK